MYLEIVKVAAKFLIGAIAVSLGSDLLKHGAKDATKIKGWKNG